MKFTHGTAGAEVVWPPAGGAGKSSNDNSVVMRLSDGGVHFLLTGDIERRIEDALIAENEALASVFLKVPHHGSKTSSSAEFLAAVALRFAVFSVGAANPFGHPAAAVLERYEQTGASLLRTDEDGAITALTDGSSISVHRYADE